MSAKQAVQSVLVRELLTVGRSRAYIGMIVGVAFVAGGMLAAGGGVEIGYVPAALDLLLPFEIIVPAVAIALGYRTITDDERRGELDVLETYPVPSWAYVLGIYGGRAIALAGVVVIPLALAGLYVSTQSPPNPTTLATHGGIDSPILFARFVVLTLLYGLATLALALAVSALAWSRRRAIVLAILLLGGVVVGVDLAVLRGFGIGWIADQQLRTALALSPTSAYRGLVLEEVLYVAFDAKTGYAASGASLLGLVGWTAVGLAVTVAGVDRRN